MFSGAIDFGRTKRAAVRLLLLLAFCALALRSSRERASLRLNGGAIGDATRSSLSRGENDSSKRRCPGDVGESGDSSSFSVSIVICVSLHIAVAAAVPPPLMLPPPRGEKTPRSDGSGASCGRDDAYAPTASGRARRVTRCVAREGLRRTRDRISNGVHEEEFLRIFKALKKLE
tara:strand:- start:234 stop:755 length:522 start_codon:yes stop_codon:yes gene_type:complete